MLNLIPTKLILGDRLLPCYIGTWCNYGSLLFSQKLKLFTLSLINCEIKLKNAIFSIYFSFFNTIFYLLILRHVAAFSQVSFELIVQHKFNKKCKSTEVNTIQFCKYMVAHEQNDHKFKG